MIYYKTFTMKKLANQKNNNLRAKEIVRMLEKNKDKLHGFGVTKIGLFGSFLKKKQHTKSDLDFIVMFGELTFDNYMELKFFLEKLFHRKVDLVIEENIKPALEYVKEEALYAEGL